MKRRRVILDPVALDDLRRIRDWIAAKGAPRTAAAYVERIRGHLRTLDVALERGMPRDDLLTGLRIFGVESVVVAIRVDDEQVSVLRVFRAGQNWERWLRPKL